MPKPEWKPVYGKNVYSTPAQVRQKAAQTAAAAPLATPLAAARHEVAQLDKRLTTHPVLVDRQDWQAPHTMPPVASHQERAATQVNLWSGAKENRSVPYANLGEPKAIAAPGYMMDQTRAHYEALNELHALGHANPLASGIPPAHFEAAWGQRSAAFAQAPATALVPVASHGLDTHPNPAGTIQAKREIPAFQAAAATMQQELSASSQRMAAAVLKAPISSSEAAHWGVTSAMVSAAASTYQGAANALAVTQPAHKRAAATKTMAAAQSMASAAVVRGKLHK